ncbi:YbaK/EbsC family protein [Candidatus Woesearchaeota archaeon]|nr:YbaK/EbsC family protein [Candidatus Woesearchaeota archaeon]
MTEETYKEILKKLDEAGVNYEKLEHEHVHSSEDAAKVRGTSLEEAAKALVLQSKSGKIFLCVVSGHRKLDLRKIKKIIGEKNCSLAHPDVVFEATGCKVGTVPPWGNLFDIPIYADEELFTREHVVFSAGTHHNSIRMLAEDWERLVGAERADIGKSL